MVQADTAAINALAEHCATLLRELRSLGPERVFETLNVPLTVAHGQNTQSQSVELLRPHASPAVRNLDATTFRARATSLRAVLHEAGLSRALDAQGGVLAEEWDDTTAWRLLDRAVLRSLEAGGRNANRRTAEKVANALIQQIREGATAAEMVVPLPSLGWDASFRLGERVSIRVLRAEEVRNVLVSYSGPWPGTVPTHGLIVSVQQSLRDGFNFQSHWLKVTQALLALRLVGVDPGVPLGAVMQYVGTSVGPRSEGASTWRHGIDPPTPLPLAGVTASRLRRAKEVFANLDANEALVDYVDAVRGREHGALFLSTRGGGAMRSLALNTILRRLGEKAGVPKVHPHRFRHTFATWAIRSHAREIDVQSLLGHSSLTMVQRYSRTYSSEQAVQAHETFSPVAQLGVV